MATIRKLLSGNYQVLIRIKGLPHLSNTFSKKKDALNFAKQVEGDTELHRKLGKASSNIPTLKSFINDCYIPQYSGKDPSTVGRLKFWCDEFDDLPVTKIDEFMVDDGLIKLSNKGLTGSTINRYKSTLSAVFIYFIKHPNFKRAGFTNPVRKESVSTFKENPPKDRFLSSVEQHELLKACSVVEWNKFYLLVLLALTTGARKGELLNLKWTDIDFQARVARLHREETKNTKPKLLPLTKNVVEELMGFRENSTALVFHNTTSKTKPYDIRKSWLKTIKQSGIEYCRFHDLRHTAASNLVAAGRTLFEVGTLLGHSSTTMTARYSHLAIQNTQYMVDKVMGGLR